MNTYLGFDKIVPPKPGLVTLENCPPGLFLHEGDYGFKTEYYDDNGPQAYCVQTGEYFWGGAEGDSKIRSRLLVKPCEIRRALYRVAVEVLQAIEQAFDDFHEDADRNFIASRVTATAPDIAAGIKHCLKLQLIREVDEGCYELTSAGQKALEENR